MKPGDFMFKQICSQCKEKAPDIVEDFASGDIICRRCGSILGDRIIDTRSEWRTFSSDGGAGEDPSRVGGPSNPLLNGSQLETTISSRDGHSGLAKDLGRLQGRSSANPSERHLTSAFREIGALCERMALPRAIADRARALFKLSDDQKIFRNSRDTENAIIGACIYIACRQENVVRAFKDISALTRVPKRDIGRCFKMLSPLLETTMKTVTGEDFVVRFCAFLNLGIEVQKVAVQVASACQNVGRLAGKSPISIAAATIFLVSNLVPNSKKPIKDISTVSGVSEGTIKQTYREIFSFNRQIVPQDMHDLIPNLPTV